MKLARNMTAALTLGILAVMCGYAYLQIRQEVVLSDADVQRAQRLGRIVRMTLEEIWNVEGETRVRELLEQVNSAMPELEIQVVALDGEAIDPHWPALTAEQVAAVAAGSPVHITGMTRMASNGGTVMCPWPGGWRWCANPCMASNDTFT